MLLSYIKKSEFIKNTAILTVGTAIAQFFPFLLSPVLSRLYSTEDFGIWALFLSFASIPGIISGLRYENAIVLPREEEKAKALVKIALKNVVWFALMLTLLILIFHRPLLQVKNFDKLGIFMYLIPLQVFALGSYQVLNFWSTRHKTFKLNALSKVSQSVVMLVVNLGVVLLFPGPFGLIAGTIGGQLAAFVVLFFTVKKNDLQEIFRIPKSLQKSTRKEYESFLKINTPHAFIDSLLEYGVMFLINFMYNETILGAYSFSLRMLRLPLSLVSASISQVFYQKAGAMVAEGKNIMNLTTKTFAGQLLIGLPFFLTIGIWGDNIFAFVFSEEYRLAGTFSQIFASWVFLRFIVSSLAYIPIIFGRLKWAFFISASDLVLRLSSLFLGYYYGDYKWSFIIMNVSCSLLLIYALTFYFVIVKKGTHKIQRDNLASF